MKRLGIFGGTFNPVHNGHLILALEAVHRAQLEHMLLVPNSVPSHKRTERALLSVERRVELLQTAFEGLSQFSIDRREVVRGGISYSVDTLRELRLENPGTELVFLIGSDSLAELHRWRQADELLQLATFLVHPRSGHGGPYPVLGAHPEARIEFLEGPIVDISSTLVRERWEAGLTLRGFVPESVEALLRTYRDAGHSTH